MFTMRQPDMPEAIAAAIGPMVRAAAPVGSRITCSPPPTDTDEDWLLLVNEDPEAALLAAGFTQDGQPQFYTGNDQGSFRSWRHGDLNAVTTPEPEFYDRFLTATALAKRYNLLDKSDRIALFQAVLYGVSAKDLEWSSARSVNIPAAEAILA